MQETVKPKGLAKIWREIKRPLKRFIRDAVGYEELRCELVCFIQRTISTAVLHQKTFSQFKNIHHGQEVVLVACGSTVKDYKRIDHAIHIGVNRAFQLENIDLRYLFMVDYANVKSYIKEANQYKPESCVKFYGLIDWVPEFIISESDVIEANALRFRERDYRNLHISPTCLIDTESFIGAGSVVFSAMQFALWTNPRVIYLVGCDCCNEHFYENESIVNNTSELIANWIRVKEFAKLYYPETKIVSINPVGLKGMFRDVYTESYLNREEKSCKKQ